MFQKSFASIVLTSCLFSQTTMCYKENFTTPSKLEISPLDGGECNSLLSVNDMNKNGWTIKDISTSKAENGVNYTYIFQKEIANQIVVTPKNETLKSQFVALENERNEEKKQEKEREDIINGKKVYEKECATCHGINGELRPYTSGQLIGINSDDFVEMMRDYGLNQRDNGAGLLMSPYSLISKEQKEVAKYLESINVLKKPIDKKESK